MSVDTITNLSSDIEIVQEIRDLFEAARKERKPRIDTWQQNYRIVHNRSWGMGALSWTGGPQVSETWPILSGMVGWMTDQRTSLSVIPSMDPHSAMSEFYSTMARDLELVLKSSWFINCTDQEVEKMLWDALIYGTGILKTTWNQALAGGLGDAEIMRIDPWRFYPDPAATDMDEANYFIEARTMSRQECERRWPGAKAKIDGVDETAGLDTRDDVYRNRQRAPMANPGGVAGVNSMWGRPGGDTRNSGRGVREDDAVTVYEAWLRENNQFTTDDGDIYIEDSWRVIVVAANNVLMNEPAKELWGHGRHPYVRYVPSEMGEFWGVSLVEQLAPLQLSINKLMASIQTNAELIGNPVFMEDSRSNISRTQITNKAGTRLQKSAGSEVEWMRPPEMPPFVAELIKFYIGEMERVSGLSAIVRGATPTGRNAQGVIDSVQEAAFVRVRVALRNLEYTLRQTGQLAASLVVENFTTPRIAAIVGSNGEQSALALKARHFMVPTLEGAVPMEFQLWVQAGSSLPISRQARSQEADVLFAMGAIDKIALLQAHDYPNRNDIVARLQAQEQAAAQGQGAPPGPPNQRSATRVPGAA